MTNVTDQIKEKIDIVEFIGEFVQLKRAGRNYLGFCPFHSNTRTPSFTVFPETQSYHCFGCKASGTVFDFVMQREGLEFRDVLEQLARRAGVVLQERTADDVQEDQRRTRLLEINAAAAAFFHHLLVRSPRGEAARAYAQQRAISQDTLEAFQLGYAVDEWSALLSYLTDRKGFEPDEIVQAGLAIHREQGGYYDRFRGRLMFPIRNAKGDIIAFGGRAMGDAQPKYMNSPQTLLFDKSGVLYGFDLAHEAIRRGEAAVIVEGYVDVIMAHQYGFRNVVAPLGTALTPQHVEIIKRLARRVYLALDADAAGIRAALKGVQTLQDQADGELVAITSPHGVVGLQRSQRVEIRVIALPEGQDPDEVIQRDQGLWRRLVDEAQPAMEFYIQALTSDLELSSARGKAQAVERLAPLLAQVTNPVEHAYYIQHIARLIDIDEQSILRALPQSREAARTPRSQPAAGRPHQQMAEGSGPAAAAVDALSQREEHLLGWVMRYPSARDAVQEKLRRDLATFALVQQSINGSILDLLQRVEHRAIWSAWEEAPSTDDVDAWAEQLDETLRPSALRALSHRLPDPQAYRYVNDALECATILQQYQAQRWHKRFRHEAHEAVDTDARAQALEIIVQLQEYLGMISAPRRSSTYADLHNLHSV